MPPPLDERLLNEFQHHFPMHPRPFDALAQDLDSNPRAVLERLRALQSAGTVSRVGPVFRPNTIGASTLAAMAVPEAALEDAAALVNGYREINHNYEREHPLNLWFVATASSPQQLGSVLSDIERRSGCPVLSLSLVRDYHIDLGFPLNGKRVNGDRYGAPGPVSVRETARPPQPAGPEHDRLVRAIQQGLPLVERPYRACGDRVGLSESDVICGIEALRRRGIIKRFGIIVRHHELGYRANAMAVWDLPDTLADAIGSDLGSRPDVTLCYRRTRRLPVWPYNLFCMIHGKAREPVTKRIEELSEEFNLGSVPRAILFSVRRFKQRGALYTTPAPETGPCHG